MSAAASSGARPEPISDRLRSVNERTSAELLNSLSRPSSHGRLAILGAALAAFARAYFSSKGIGKGKAGYIYAWSAGLEAVMKGAKRWEYELRNGEGRGAFPPSTPGEVTKANAKYVSSSGL